LAQILERESIEANFNGGLKVRALLEEKGGKSQGGEKERKVQEGEGEAKKGKEGVRRERRRKRKRKVRESNEIRGKEGKKEKVGYGRGAVRARNRQGEEGREKCKERDERKGN
jgi:hypothetical protein